MRTLIQNYSTAISSEPFYTCNALLAVQSEAILWADGNISAFDMIDSANPDVFITHALYLTDDILKRLANSDIDLVLNITSVSTEDIAHVESLLKKNNIKCPFMFTNQMVGEYSKPENYEVHEISPCADIFLPKREIPDYHLPELIVFSRDNENVERATKDKEVYHTASFGEGFDIQADVVSLASFYDRYDKVTIADDLTICLSQLFFDATLRSNALSIEVTDDQRQVFNGVIGKLFDGDEPEEKGSIQDFIKGKIRKDHTCVNRVTEIAKHLGDADLSQKLETLSRQIAEEK